MFLAWVGFYIFALLCICVTYLIYFGGLYANEQEGPIHGNCSEDKQDSDRDAERSRPAKAGYTRPSITQTSEVTRKGSTTQGYNRG